MQIRLINATPLFRGWNGRQPGAVIDIPDGVANTLIQRGVAKLIEEPKPTKGRTRASHKR
jgi:hypothetical protein